MFRIMFKDILNHPSLREAVDRCRAIEDDQKEISQKIDLILTLLNHRTIDDEFKEPASHASQDFDSVRLEIIDLSRRVYFLETTLETKSSRKTVLFQKVKDIFYRHQMLLAAAALCSATFFGIYTLFILNS